MHYLVEPNHDMVWQLQPRKHTSARLRDGNCRVLSQECVCAAESGSMLTSPVLTLLLDRISTIPGCDARKTLRSRDGKMFLPIAEDYRALDQETPALVVRLSDVCLLMPPGQGYEVLYLQGGALQLS